MMLIIRTAFLAVILLAARPGAFADDARQGDKVAAKWNGGSYYIATVTDASGGRFNVLYGDGTKGNVTAADMIRVVPGTNFNVGDHVLAVWKGAHMFPGTITAKTVANVTVKWDDGDRPLDVPLDQVVLFPRGAAPAQALASPANRGPALAVGTPVAAKWHVNSWYIATIARVKVDGSYFVKYGDGDSATVAPGDVLPVNAAQALPVGAHVQACWKGAIMYPGTVTARRGDHYTIKWDDGDKPLEVERTKIAPLPVR